MKKEDARNNEKLTAEELAERKKAAALFAKEHGEENDPAEEAKEQAEALFTAPKAATVAEKIAKEQAAEAAPEEAGAEEPEAKKAQEPEEAEAENPEAEAAPESEELEAEQAQEPEAEKASEEAEPEAQEPEAEKPQEPEAEKAPEEAEPEAQEPEVQEPEEAEPEAQEPEADQAPEQAEETVTLTKAEFNQLLFNKLAEGQRKAQKEVAEKIANLEAQVAQHAALGFAKKAGIDEEHREDVIAIVRGRGLELTEENIAEVANRFPEWKKSAKASQIAVGATKGSEKPPKADPQEAAKKLFGF